MTCSILYCYVQSYIGRHILIYSVTPTKKRFSIKQTFVRIESVLVKTIKTRTPRNVLLSTVVVH